MQTQQSLERDLRAMESTLQGMQAQNNPMVQHYQNQVNLVKQRVDQMGDMYIGYTAAISVSPCQLSRSPQRNQLVYSCMFVCWSCLPP